MASGTKTDTVDLLTTEMAAKIEAEEDALINGTVSEVAVDNFDQAREDEYLKVSYNNYLATVTNDASNDDSLIGAQQVNGFLSGNQQAYLQRRRTKLARRLDRETTRLQNVSVLSDGTPIGVINSQLKNVGVIVDPFYLTNLLKTGQTS